MQSAGVPALRILATHHPLAFPYEDRDERMWFIQQMILAQSGRLVDAFRNETSKSAALRPLVHLFLSGHTHLGMPGQPLPENVKEAYQGRLGSNQLQLVSGATMLIRDREAVRQQIGPQVDLKDRKDFAIPHVFDANQQFQILRFFFDESRPDSLRMDRTVMARLPNALGGQYHGVKELASSTWFSLSPTKCAQSRA